MHWESTVLGTRWGVQFNQCRLWDVMELFPAVTALDMFPSMYEVVEGFQNENEGEIARK